MTEALKLNHALSSSEHQRPAPKSGVLRRIGMGLLMLVVVVVAVMSTLPILLLFFFTSVPAWIAAVLLLIDIGIVIALFRSSRTPLILLGATATWVLVAVLGVFLSQQFASTPPINDAAGNVIPGSIATLETVELNGSQQWITIRAYSPDLPVLLFLAGGPGGSELVMTRRYLGELEKHFTVVNWDQPGAGKSYNAVPLDALTPERYVSDAYELTLYLRERFHQEKIYVFGESWGSILGVWLVQEHPELFHAFISSGQMVDTVQNDSMGHDLALEFLTEQGRLDDAAQLRRNGSPPYDTGELIGKFQADSNVLNAYMNSHAHGEGLNANLLLDSLAGKEYGLMDKVNWLLGLAQTFPTVYPQIYDLDFRTQATHLEVPAYFIKGRWDVNAINALLEEYFTILEAPHKELIWFEDSAHTPMWDEPAHFVDVMINTVLAQTQPK